VFLKEALAKVTQEIQTLVVKVKEAPSQDIVARFGKELDSVLHIEYEQASKREQIVEKAEKTITKRDILKLRVHAKNNQAPFLVYIKPGTRQVKTLNCQTSEVLVYSVQNLPTFTAASYATTFLDHKTLLICGGYNHPNLMDSAFSFDATNGTFEAHTNMLVPRARPGICTYQGKAYVFGGDQQGTAEVYDVKNRTWTMLPNLPFESNYVSCDVVGDSIFIVNYAST
jgi:hypothetical protein